MKPTRAILILAAVVACSGSPLWAEEPAVTNGQPVSVAKVARVQTATEKKAIEYLISIQDKDGAWTAEAGPAITALAVRTLVQGGRTVEDPAVKKGLAFIEKFRQEDGGYYKDAWPNYSTCIVLGLFAQLPHDAYKDKITKAQDFLKSIQSVEGKKDDQGNLITREHAWFGGAGYAGKGARRPDLSNTAFFIDALRESGVSVYDPAIQNAIVFVSRCQMNETTNDQSFAKGQSSGGFVYSTFKGGESQFGVTKDREGNEILTAYGSMTYAGLKSFIYAGLTKNDPRVKQAWKWIKETWTLDTNPGTQSEMGLYYYYHTFAKALRISGEDSIVDAKGVAHDWRKELETKMAALQKTDGHFVNNTETKEGQRWMEANPSLVTSYSIMALQEARK
ncbi:MAG: prenyltransferase/squalene oxidase repeat-containing protein [Phycisphaerae bacterium]